MTKCRCGWPSSIYQTLTQHSPTCPIEQEARARKAKELEEIKRVYQEEAEEARRSATNRRR